MEATEEWQKMVAGELYRSGDPALDAVRRHARRLTRLFNQTTEEELDRRRQIICELFGRLGSEAEIEPPLHCDYGCNIHAGDRLYMNFGCVILDCARVDIGTNVFMGPGVHIYAAYHPIDARVRNSGRELAAPVRIGNSVWIGGRAVICPGVTIGEGSIIGAGSVVVRDIPPNIVAVGNPCRVIRTLAEQKP